ncbi:glycosyltransferase family 39 protein [Microbacteriaceae bacterium K1510]|nr:glycosyltransferase family 39 protein [Microbacteriaceae bacterium K1510]
MIDKTKAARPATIWADRAAIIILVAVALAAALTFRDYGLGWDDYTHSQYGDLLLKLYGTGFADARALSFVNLYKYGGGFDMLAGLVAKISPFTLFETRRLVGAAVGIVGLLITWRLTRRLGGPIAGLIALALLATCPIYYGHMFINAKDAPFAVAMVLLLFGAVRALDEYPNPNARTMVLVGLGIGATFGSRILAVVAGPYIAAGVALILATEISRLGIGKSFSRFGQFVPALLPALPLGYLIMGLLWPWSILSPLNPLHAAEYFDKFFEKPWRELYEGVRIAVPDMPASYLPHLFLLKLPEAMLVLGAIGFVGALITVVRPAVALNRRACLLTVVLAAAFPVVLALIMRPALYNGLRHFVFVIPPLAVLGGIAGGWIAEWLRARSTIAVGVAAAVFAAAIALPVSELVRLHPYEYSSFNWASGGVRAAQGRYMLDYWGLAFKQAAQGLRAHLKRTGEKPPAGRRWVIAICGPQAPADVELGPQFETTWEEKRADFAMSLGTFYCEDIARPVLVDIQREGVMYARVYDLRGRPTPNLLTEPPP